MNGFFGHFFCSERVGVFFAPVKSQGGRVLFISLSFAFWSDSLTHIGAADNVRGTIRFRLLLYKSQ